MGDLHKIFNPRTIAVIGATDKEGSFGRETLENALASANRVVYPVNPDHETLLGRECWSNIGSIPEEVDLAIIATPAATVPGIVESCGRAGVSGLIIISAGFRERGAEGIRLENEITRINQAYKMRIVGPSCLGIIRPPYGLKATFFTGKIASGGIAFISDAGTFGRTLLDWGVSSHIGFSAVVSLGSAIDVTFWDVIDFLFEDPHTKSIILYMEEMLVDVKHFVSAVRCFASVKPIILLKTPGLKEKPCPGLTHSGMMACQEEVLDALARRLGVVRVHEAHDLFNAAGILCSGNRPCGPRLAIVTNARGIGIIVAKQLLRSGGKLAVLSDKTIKGLDGILPSWWSGENPVHLLRDADVPRYAAAVEIILKDPEVDGLLAVYTPQDFTDPEELADALAALSGTTDKPLLSAWMGGSDVQRGRERMMAKGFPAYDSAESAVRAYIYMNQYERNLHVLQETPAELPLDEAPPKNHLKAIIRRLGSDDYPILTEDEAMKFLRNYGIPVIATRTAPDIEHAVMAAEDVGYPVVLKIESPDIVFRQDVGGVVTGIENEASLRSAHKRIMANIDHFAPRARVRGVVIQKMLEHIDYELILGSRKDSNIGAVILLESGGIGVEMMKDFSVGLPPLNQALARQLIEDEPGVYRMLQGFRGKMPADLRQMEQILVGFSRMIVDFPEILEMDINPLAVSQGKAVALDARILLDRDVLSGKIALNPYSHLAIAPYPTRHTRLWRLKDGTEAVLRPIRPEDEPLLQEMLSTCSEETIRSRYYHNIGSITHALLVRACHIDYARDMTIVAEIRSEGEKRIVAMGSLTADVYGGTAGEFAIIVHDEFQKRGLAAKLLDMLIGIAGERGFKEFYGFIEPTNGKMASLCHRLGMSRSRSQDDLIRVSLPLNW